MCQSSPSLAILVPLRFIIISLMFFYLAKLLLCFLQFKGIFYLAKITHTTVTSAPLRFSTQGNYGAFVTLSKPTLFLSRLKPPLN